MTRQNWLYAVLSLLFIAFAMIVIVHGPGSRLFLMR